MHSIHLISSFIICISTIELAKGITLTRKHFPETFIYNYIVDKVQENMNGTSHEQMNGACKAKVNGTTKEKANGSTKPKVQTLLTQLGRNPDAQSGFVNCPVYRGSTVVYKTMEDVDKGAMRYFYGTAGNPTISNLEDAWTTLTGGAGTVIVSSGLGAVTLAILAVVKAGDTILMVDSVYLPTRTLSQGFLKRMGVTTIFYSATISPEELEALLAENESISLILFESPGSQTFEFQDIPALSAVAHRHNVVTMVDNTWATPLFFDAHGKGCDISVEAGTKYLGGHSDILLGLVSANEKYFPAVRKLYDEFAMLPGNDDCFLALRGMRTMHLRLKEAERRGIELATWLKDREEVLYVLHPIFPECKGSTIWRRDYTGSSGVFSFILKPSFSREQANKMLNSMTVFSMGYSWGGFESLILIYDCTTFRTACRFEPGGVLIRVQVGFEDMEDIKRDLSVGFENLNH